MAEQSANPEFSAEPGADERTSWQKAVVDRLVDGRYAVLLVGQEETEKVVELDCLQDQWRQLLQPGAWLRVQFRAEELTALEADESETAARAQRIRDKMDALRERGRQADP